ncbi:putative ribonuclease H protein At1g65750 family [Senna tora]|uniref:Putative ribonuclease H protein At1g65750 family n=1 Tax=Senna tora TaxID=362788 RepID=A0A834TKM0_9FABA|nr:putative ribonuclease H protein At1g65750 family [Senna tora]
MNSDDVWIDDCDSLREMANRIEENIAWNVGDGNQVRFWKDIWVHGQGRLIDNVLIPPPENIVDMPVNFFSTLSGGWDWSKIDPYVSRDVHSSIEASTPPVQGRNDCVRWRRMHDGNFSIRSAYECLSAGNGATRSTFWSRIWKWPVHERIRSFIWLLAHGKILTNSHRLHRNLTNNASCPRCGREEETVLHAIRDCNVIEWNSKIHAGNDLSENWQSTFGVTCWYVWKNRNLLVFENHTPNMQDLFFQILYMVVIECDSEVALELVENGTTENHPCSGLVHQIRSLVDRNWDINLVHAFREANQTADLMAKMSHTLSEGLHVFCYPHKDLGYILTADLYGPLVPRVCVC